MTKQEFLEKLRLTLSGKVSSEVIEENARFYEDYISSEMSKGKSEAEVLGMLGDPRLIAKTIVETSAGRGSRSANQSADFAEESGSGQSGYPECEKKGPVRKTSGLTVPGWVWVIVALVVVVLIVSAVFSVLSALLPVLIPILVVLFLVKLFRDWMN